MEQNINSLKNQDMANFIIGQILFIGEAQNFTSQNTGNSFTKRSLIISVRRFDPNTGEPVNDYENTPEFSFIGDKCRDLDQFKVGQNVAVYFDIVGRKYTPQGGTEKIINDIRPYKIELYGRAATEQSPMQPQTATAPQAVASASVATGSMQQPQQVAQGPGFTSPI